MRVCSFVAVLLGVGLGVGRVAHADTGTLPGGMTVKFNRLMIHEHGSSTLAPPSNTVDATWTYFNLAHCQCDKANYGQEDSKFKEGTFAWELIPQNSTSVVTRPANIWVGSACDQILTRAMTCSRLDYATISSIETLQQKQVATPEVRLFDLMNPEPTAATGPCQERSLSTTEWFVADGDGDGTDDYFASAAVDTDTLAPTLPTVWRASGAESAINIEWDVPSGDLTDIFAYQALCAKSDGTAADLKSRPSPRYETSDTLCSVPSSDTLTASTIDTGDLGDAGMVTGAVDGLASMNPAFLCGEQTSPTATSMRIEGLENGQDYQVAVLIMDKFGNARGTYFTSLLRPVPSTDFWEDIHGRGGKVQGGLCRIGSVGTGGSVLVIVGALVLVVRRRRRRGGTIAALLCGLLAFGGSRVASADDTGGYDPNWNEPDGGTSAYSTEEAPVKWHAGIRLGPYTPQIDAQLGLTPGPFKAMFGGSTILPMLDVERIVWRGFGQVGVGGNIGFMSKKAHTFIDGSDPTDPMRPRAPGDTNTFRLIPFAITGVYRFTVLDDLYGIPVVPYAKVGLAYDVWWMKGPNGNLSFTCTSGMAPNCPKDTAYGGSLGVQGTIGLAIRAERIDANAAKQMHESGLEHAGFYGELQLAKVDGFGSAQKLSVGDNTWFAGVDFEF